MHHFPSERSYSPSQECEKLIDKINRINIKRDTKNLWNWFATQYWKFNRRSIKTRGSPMPWCQSYVNNPDPFDLDLPQVEPQEAMTNIPPRHQVYEDNRNPQQHWDDDVHHHPPHPHWHRPPHHWGRPPHRGRGPRGFGHPPPHRPPHHFYGRGRGRGCPSYYDTNQNYWFISVCRIHIAWDAGA